MSNPTSRVAYAKYYEVFDKALAAEKGIRLAFPSQSAALAFQGRMHQARTIDRNDNKKVYEPGHKMHGCSAYDVVSVSRPRMDTEGEWWLYIEPNDRVDVHIEEL